MLGVRTVLIVAGDAPLRQSLAEQLELNAEFAAAQCDSGAAALQAVEGQRYDAVLLDASLPDISGRDLCRRLRAAGIAVPIILLAAPSGGDDAPPALDAGADDYVTRPFRLNALLARLRAHLRESEVLDDAVLTIGPYAFRPSAKLLSHVSGRKHVRLTEKEAAILKFLYRAGRAIGRETLLGEVWGYNAGVATHTLETHVYRLRRKIEPEAEKPTYIHSVPGIGYRFAG